MTAPIRSELQAMRRAEQLAWKSNPHPNPRVGAVILDRSGVIVGEGYHEAPGHPHAEVMALRAAGPRAQGATLLVTLEPCDHYGRTPPCTEAILGAGIKRVVVGASDPDPLVSGRGSGRLQRSGIEVEVGSGGGEEVDPAYFHHRRTGRPLVTLKVAATLDGQTAAADGTSQWITSESARTDSHLLRAEVDAVMIGAGTLRADDPALTVRRNDFTGPQPRPVIIAGTQPLPVAARLRDRRPIVVSTSLVSGFEEVVVVGAGADGLPDLNEALAALGKLGLLAILVEGGPRLAAALARAGLIDRGVLYLGAVLAQGSGRPMFDSVWPTLNAAQPVTIERAVTIGPDLRIDFHVHRDH